MSGFGAIAIIVVVWLFVLAPLALRGQKPIRRTNDAFEKTRVVYEGGSGDVPVQRGPKISRKDIRRVADDAAVEDVPVSDIVVDATPRAPESVEPPHDIDGELVAANPTPNTAVVDGGDAEEKAEVTGNLTPASDAEPVALPNDDGEGHYLSLDYYAETADLLHPDGRYEVAETEDTTDTEPDHTDTYDDVTDEDKAFAAQRRGRGFYDPEADASRATTRYERRQRTVIVLLATLAIGLILGVGFGGWWWVAPTVAAASAAAYLAELRRQVKAERELRRRRLRHLRRARLGVRTDRDEVLGIPQRLRRPGAVVLEVDDESPDFDPLPEIRYADEFYADDDYVSLEPPARFYESQRRAG